MGKQRYTAEQVADALTQFKGNAALAAHKLKCDRHTVANYIERYVCCQDACERGREERIDLAEGNLDAAVMAGDVSAIKFTLSTIGKKRGYSETIAVTGPNGGPQEHNVNTVVDFKGRTVEELEEIQARFRRQDAGPC